MHIELPSPPPPYPQPPPPLDNNVIGTNQCLCLPKAKLNTKTAAVLPSAQVCGVQIDSN